MGKQKGSPVSTAARLKMNYDFHRNPIMQANRHSLLKGRAACRHPDSSPDPQGVVCCDTLSRTGSEPLKLSHLSKKRSGTSG